MVIGNFVNMLVQGAEREVVFKAIISEIQTNTGLEKLYLRANRLTEVHLAQLADALTEHSSLSFIDLSYNEIHASAIPFLKKIIQQNPSLKRIELGHNDINDNDLQSLLSGDSFELSRLKTIDFNLECNRLTEKGLKMAKGKLSPTTILNILTGNHIFDVGVREQYTDEALDELEVQQPPLRFSSTKPFEEEKEHSEQMATKTSPIPLKIGKPGSSDNE